METIKISRGITYQDVAQAAETILSQGKNPTMEAVRMELGGTGSFSTINKYLHHWRSDRLVRIAKESPTKIIAPDEVNQAVNNILEQLNNQAQEQIEKIKQEYEEKILEITKENKLYQQAEKELISALNETSTKINHLETDLTLIRKELAEERKSRAVAEEKARCDSQALTTMTTNFEKHVLDLKNTHGATVNQLKELYEQKNGFIIKDLNDLKVLLENQRIEFMVKIDNLMTAKEKIERSYFKTENDLKDQINQNTLLKEQKSLIDTDNKITLQQKQELEKTVIILKTQLNQKETVANESKEQLINLQLKYEASTEELGKLKMQIEYMQNKLKGVLHGNKKSKENA